VCDNAENLFGTHAKERVMPELPTGPFDPAPADTNPSNSSPTASLRAAEVSRFTIERLHAKGGLGQVSVAIDGQLRRRVALKEIRPDRRGDEARRRFLVEAEITGQLEHPGIVPIYALEKDAVGEPYYAMRFIQGHSLAEAIQRFHKETPSFDGLAFRTLLQRFVSVCQTVAFAHSRGFIHRDLKPANVMLGDYGETLVVDWGLAKSFSRETPASAASDEPFSGETPASAGAAPDALTKPPSYAETRQGEAIGTPSYMPPEQARGEWDRVGPAADIFSLGAILYQLFTASPPYHGGSVTEVLAKAKTGHYTTPRKVKSEVAKPLEAICLKSMALKPEDRYGAAKELAADVEHWLADEPVTAYAEPWGEQARRWMRRHRVLVTTATGVLIAGIIALTISLVIVTRLNQDLDTANNGLTASLAREKAEHQRAESEGAISKAVNDFLRNDLLHEAAVANRGLAARFAPRNPNLTVRELLDRAALKINGRFPDQPLTEASIRLTIGGTYLDLGLYDEAIPHDKRAFELRERHLGPEHPETLYCINNLGLLYHHRGQFDLAEPLLRQAVEKETARLGADHLDTITAVGNLAMLYISLGQFDKAQPLLIRVVETRTRRLGTDHPDTLLAQFYLAVLYARRGRNEQAERLLQQTLSEQSAQLGADHHDTLMTMDYLAQIYVDLAKYEQAEPLAVRVFEMAKKVKGPDHPDTLSTQDHLGLLYRYQRKYDQAETLLAEALAKRTRQLGTDHPHTLSSAHNLALVLGDQKKFDRCETLWKEVIEKRTSVLGPEHPDTLTSIGNLASLYWKRRQFQESVPLYEKVLAARRRKLGDDHPDTAFAGYNLAVNYRDAGRLADATATIEEWLPRGRSNRGFTHPATQFGVETALSIYQRTSAHAKAEPLLRDMAMLQKEKHGAKSMEYALAHYTVAENLLKQQKYADAEPILRDCLAFYESSQSGQQYVHAIKWQVGDALAGQQKYADAEPLLLAFWETVHQTAIKNPGKYAVGSNNHKRLIESIESLIRLYDGWGKKGEADKWRKVLEDTRRGAEQKESTGGKP
jgi:serine/threonine protein kinase